MNWKKLGKSLLFPHIAIRILLIPISATFLICSMIFLDTESVCAITSYALSAYTLMVWCMKIPRLILCIKAFLQQNKYTTKWQQDERLRINVSLYGALVWNTAYALLQLGLGFWHRSFWFYSLAGYYVSLALMRFILVGHTRKYMPGENVTKELIKYRICGIIFLVMNLSLAFIIFFMVYWDRTFHHHEITTITMATYTFASLTVAIVNTVKYKKYNSPVYSASKAISLASASASMLTLESTMLTTFNDGTMSALTRKLFLGISGGIVSIFVIIMAIYMIIKSTKTLNSPNPSKTANR
ncbi:MAG: hypothetical protein E7403_04135 [Ruminococcaceae bacterium]|nr:hypothetical protein [Oscillospiraceae bacterium]